MQRQLCCWAKHSASPGTDLSSPPGCSSAALACMHKMPLFWCASQIIHFSLHNKLPKEQQVLNLSFKLSFGEVLFGHQSQSLSWVLMFGKQQFWGLISLTERLSSGSLLGQLCRLLRSLLASAGYRNQHQRWKRGSDGVFQTPELSPFWWLMAAITAHLAVTCKYC